MAANINTYLQQTERFLRDQAQQKFMPADLLSYVNRARREIAMRAQCIRFLTPISGSITSASVVNPGSGYVAPTASVSAPDFPSGIAPNPGGLQATASIAAVGGTISSVSITGGGSGYFNPQITILDGVGTGASLAAVVSPINTLNANQERYDFSNVNLTSLPGVAEIYHVRSVSVIFSNYRYSLPMYPFSLYQAMIRNYPSQYLFVPTFCSQFGQGSAGSIFFYPLPSQTYQVEFDCLCLPSDLSLTTTVTESLPDPWSDSVPYMAAHLAMIELQNWNAARAFLELYTQFSQRYSDYARVGRAINPYGRF